MRISYISNIFLGVFALLQAVAISNYLRNFLTKSEFKYFFFLASSIAAGLVFLTVVGLTWAGVVAPWSGREDTKIAVSTSLVMVCKMVDIILP